MLSRPIANSVIDFIETYHTAFGDFPGRSQINQAAETANGSPFKAYEIDAFLDDELTVKSLEERGIVPPWILEKNPSGLTSEQLAVAAVINNVKDRRSDAKKLSDLGISSRKFNGWMHSRVFTDYLRVSANKIIEHSEHEAHMGLLRAVNAGNTKAIETFFAMTGRWNPAQENTVNLQQLTTRFIEIIQTHVRDPNILMAIAADLQLVSVETGINPLDEQKTITQAKQQKELPGRSLFF